MRRAIPSNCPVGLRRQWGRNLLLSKSPFKIPVLHNLHVQVSSKYRHSLAALVKRHSQAISVCFVSGVGWVLLLPKSNAEAPSTCGGWGQTVGLARELKHG